MGLYLHALLTADVSGQLHAQPLYPLGKSPSCPLHKRQGGPHSRSGCNGEKKIPAPSGIESRSSSPLLTSVLFTITSDTALG